MIPKRSEYWGSRPSSRRYRIRLPGPGTRSSMPSSGCRQAAHAAVISYWLTPPSSPRCSAARTVWTASGAISRQLELGRHAMSHDRSGPTRRGFLGTATVATAATMAIPAASQAQTPSGPFVLTKSDPAQSATAANALSKPRDWTQPAAMAIPKEGYFKYEQGRYGPLYPRTPANYGLTISAKIKPGTEETIRRHGKTIEDGIAGDPTVVAPLKLHYLRWVLFPINSEAS